MRTWTFLGFLLLAFTACAHYPDNGGNAPPDAGGNYDNGSCTGSSCPTDGGSDSGSGGGSDAGIGSGSDGGTNNGSDGGSCGTCPPGEIYADGACVCDGGDKDGCHDGKVPLCHYAPHHAEMCRTLYVGRPSDKYDGHKRHGDTDGACLPDCAHP